MITWYWILLLNRNREGLPCQGALLQTARKGTLAPEFRGEAGVIGVLPQPPALKIDFVYRSLDGSFCRGV